MMRKKSLWADQRGEFNFIGVGVGSVIAILILAWIALNWGSKKVVQGIKRRGS